jgi:hypothetical protein
MDPQCFDADADPDPAQNLDADPDPDPDPGGEGGGRLAKNVHPPWQNPRYAPDGEDSRAPSCLTVFTVYEIKQVIKLISELNFPK